MNSSFNLNFIQVLLDYLDSSGMHKQKNIYQCDNKYLNQLNKIDRSYFERYVLRIRGNDDRICQSNQKQVNSSSKAIELAKFYTKNQLMLVDYNLYENYEMSCCKKRMLNGQSLYLLILK